MTYNYHGTWDTTTGFNAPLYGRASETGQNKLFNVDSGVNYWISKGLPASVCKLIVKYFISYTVFMIIFFKKLVVGVTTYGRSFKLNQAFSSQPGSASAGAGTAGTVEN